VPVAHRLAVQVSGRYVFENVGFATPGVPPVKGAARVAIGVRIGLSP
jgi:hypothetical protein